MREERFLEDLPCELRDAEVMERGERVATLFADRAMTKAELDEARAQAKNEIKRIDAEISTLCTEIRNRKEVRPVYCVERANNAIDQVEIIRTDTGAVVKSRAFEHDERQLGFELSRDEGEMPDPLEDEPSDDELDEQTAPI